MNLPSGIRADSGGGPYPSPLHHKLQARRPSADSSFHRQDRSDSGIEPPAFDRFLCWLDPDREAAGQKYESIRHGLILMFRRRGCGCAEDLTDATFNRVVSRLPSVSARYSGDPVPYFYGVAKRIYLEYLRRNTARFIPLDAISVCVVDREDDLQQMFERLDSALSKLDESDRNLILTYYSGTGRTTINGRKGMADQFGLKPNTLRIRVFRIRARIKKHIFG